jgi:hypothetical protein
LERLGEGLRRVGARISGTEEEDDEAEDLSNGEDVEDVDKVGGGRDDEVEEDIEAEEVDDMVRAQVKAEKRKALWRVRKNLKR